jgi:hypothetical protein
MQLLGLSEPSLGSLPASRFPERASAYFCDKCGEDITGGFHIRRGHGGTPLGPPTFHCVCGERYLSGACEWDQLRSYERRTELVGGGIAALFAVPFLGSLTAAALGIHSRSPSLTIAGIALTLLTSPFSVALWLSFLMVRDIAASIFRTRVLSRLNR